MPTTQEARLLSLTTPLPYDHLLIKRIRAFEGISQLFRFDLEMLHEENEAGSEPTLINPHDLLGQKMTVAVVQADGAERFFNGICVDFSQGNRNDRFSKYRAELVPQFWLLTQNSQSRIFQNLSVPEILRQVLSGIEFNLEVQGTFEPRNYCVQYRETDFDFASRLMEEEGIFYYFAHTADSHRMIIANTPGSHRECPSKSEIPFQIDVSADLEEWSGAVLSWLVANKLRAGKFTLRDHNFQLPAQNLEAEQTSRFNIGGNQNLENYDYPGVYANRFDGIDATGGEQPNQLQKIFDDRQRTVSIRQQEIDVAYNTSTGTSNCCAMTAGHRFQLTTHPDATNNRNHVLVSVRTEAVQSPGYVSDDPVSNSYMVSFASIPQGEGQAQFRPLRRTKKPVIQGCQTATVVGPSGEEIFTDKYGRVKVQFRWDRQGQADAKASCWIRVVQTWAGKKWGTMFIPRIGMETVVDFIEGDPDQPIITGCVYNADAMPPYTLPDEKTKSTMKTNSSKGGNGFNELRFEDKKGSEQIFIHAEKNEDIRVKNDCFETIGAARHLTVGGDQMEKVGGSKHLTITGDQNEDIDGAMSLLVGGDVDIISRGSIAMGGTSEIFIKSKVKVIIEAPQVSLKASGNFVDVGPAGVTIKGTMVLINSGGAAGSADNPNCTPPAVPGEADKADAGKKMPTPPPPASPSPAYQMVTAAAREQAQNPAAPGVQQVAQQILAALPPLPALPAIPPVPTPDIAAAIAAAEQSLQNLTEEAKALVDDAVEKVKNSPLIASVMEKVNEVKDKAEEIKGQAEAKIDEAKAAAEEIKQMAEEKVAEGQAKVDEAKAEVEAAKAKVEEARQEVEQAKETVEQAAAALEGVGEQAAAMAQAAQNAVPFI